MLLDWLLQ